MRWPWAPRLASMFSILWLPFILQFPAGAGLLATFEGLFLRGGSNLIDFSF